MAAPTQITGSPWQSAWTSIANGAAKLAPTASTFAVSAGDLILVRAATEDNGVTFATPTNAAGTSPATITWTARSAVAVASFTRVYTWTGAVTVAGNVQVSSVMTAGGSAGSGIIVNAFSAHGGVGVDQPGNSATGSPAVTLALSANSFVGAVLGDWSATLVTATPTTAAGTATVDNAAQVDSNYSTAAWSHADSGSAGSKSIGLSNTGTKWSMAAVEVLAASGAAAPAASPRTFNAIPFIGGGL